MAIKFASNIQISGKNPDITRQEYATFEEMRAVKKNSMPELYLAYCLEDRNFYIYDKQLEDDPVTGKFRIFQGGATIQVDVMPEADASQVGKIYQYTGATEGGFTNGYFYICNASGETQTVDITTLDALKETINESENVFEVNNGTETVETKAFVFDSVNYYVLEDVIYSTSNATGDISVDTVIYTDEAVATLNLTKEVVVYTYSWSNKTVQPTSEIGDVVAYGGNFPANPEDGCVFLYMGPNTYTYSYEEVTPEGTENPSEEGWYEEDSGNYILSVDTEVDAGKTYYTRSEEEQYVSETAYKYVLADAEWVPLEAEFTDEEIDALFD